MKVVINSYYGGFGISKQAAEFMAKRGNKNAIAELTEDKGDKDYFYGYGYADGFPSGYDRTDPDLIAAVEELGEKANGAHAKLKIVEIPDGIKYTIEEYDGYEHIAEAHRTWS